MRLIKKLAKRWNDYQEKEALSTDPEDAQWWVSAVADGLDDAHSGSSWQGPHPWFGEAVDWLREELRLSAITQEQDDVHQRLLRAAKDVHEGHRYPRWAEFGEAIAAAERETE